MHSPTYEVRAGTDCQGCILRTPHTTYLHKRRISLRNGTAGLQPAVDIIMSAVRVLAWRACMLPQRAVQRAFSCFARLAFGGSSGVVEV